MCACPERAASYVCLEVAPIMFLVTVCCETAFSMFKTGLALYGLSSLERRVGEPLALVAHVASVQHEAVDIIGGEALPRSMMPTNVVVVGLTNVMLASVTLWSCVAYCLRDGG